MANFYDAYTKRKAENEQAGMRDLQQMGTLVQLQQGIQARQQQQQEQELMKGGSLEDIKNAAMRIGRLDIVAKIDPLIQAQKKIQPLGSGGGVGPDGKVIPPAARPETPKPPAPTRLAQLMTERDALPPGDQRRVVYEAAIKKESERADPIQVNQFGSPVAGVDAQGNPVFFQPGRTGGPPQIVPGVKPPPKADEAGLTPENAGKVSMAQQSVESIGTVRNIIFDKEGNLNRGVVMAMNLPGVSGLPLNSQARIARSAMRNAVEAKLRLETGAAATESEVDRTIARFMPTFADTKESAKFKLDELEKFFKGSLSLTKGIKKPSPKADDPLGLRGN